ncbi:MAG: RNA polymerase sigma factor [Planctomycetes bacterium]|nr:RNA polymerase sigma factor [Planctomycetota bacterium]
MGRTATLKAKTMAKAPSTANTAAEDRTLLRAIAERRDRAAFAELFARHQQAAYNLARHLTSSRDAAEDIVQEALVRIWSNADSFRGDGTVRSWLLRIVARESIRAYRKANAEGNRVVRKQRLMPAPEMQNAPAVPEDSEELVALRASVAQLPERQRTLLALYFGAEMSQEEIGKHLAMPQSSVSRSIQDLLEQLRGSLGRAGLAAAAPVLGAEQMQAAVLGGEAAPAGLLEGILARLADAGRSVSVKAAVVSSSPAWIGWIAAAVLALSAGAWWALQAPQDKPHFSEAPAATAAEAPASESEVKTEPPAAGPGVYGYSWTFEGRLSSEFERLSGKTRFVKDKRTGVHGLHFDPKDETCYLLRVPLRDKAVRVTATVVEIPLAERMGAPSTFSFAITDGETSVASKNWRVADHIDWHMKEVDTFTYYISANWAFAYAGGGVRTVVNFERGPADRFLAITGQYIVLKVLELKELEPAQLPAELRDPHKLIAKMEPGMTIPRVNIRPEQKSK